MNDAENPVPTVMPSADADFEDEPEKEPTPLDTMPVLVLSMGKTVTLSATLLPKDASSLKFYAESDNE